MYFFYDIYTLVLENNIQFPVCRNINELVVIIIKNVNKEDFETFEIISFECFISS